MRNNMKAIISSITIGLFLLFALATKVSDFLDESTNEEVAISNCEAKPTVTGKVKVTVCYDEADGDPIGSTPGKLLISHQKVNSDTCTYTVISFLVVEFLTGDFECFTYEGENWTHDNSEDLFRVEVKVEQDEDGPGFRKVDVLKYNDSRFYFNYEIPAKL